MAQGATFRAPTAILFFSLLFAWSCKGPPESSSEFFALARHHLLLKPQAFEREFLLKTSATSAMEGTDAIAKLPVHLGARVVYFSQKAETVSLFQSREGKGGPLEDPGNFDNLVASFPVLEEFGDGRLLIDFQKGLADMHVGKMGVGQVKQISLLGPHLYVVQSFKKKPSSSSHEYEVDTTSSPEVYTTLSPYERNPSYGPLELKDHPGKHLTTKSVQRGMGEVHHWVGRFDLSAGKKVVFHLSQNIPQNYLQAVRDGALYWNRVLDREVVQLKGLEEDQDFFGPGVNVIQWVQWDKIPFAYTTIQSDPLTGEILQASAFITSAFTREKLPFEKMPKAPPLSEVLPPSWMSSSIVCYETEENEGTLLHPKQVSWTFLKDQGMTEEEEDEALLRYSQDSIRSTVAHEVGHALGFHHNFAASTMINVGHREFSEMAQEYFRSGVVPEGVVFSGSVLDYNPPPMDSLIGAQIRLKHETAPYDRHVAQLSYGLDHRPPEPLPFCSGEQLNEYIDCLAHDSGDSISWALPSYHQAPQRISFALVQKYEFLLARDYQVQQKSVQEMIHDIREAPLWPEISAAFLLDRYNNFMNLFSQGTEFLSIRSLYPKILTMMDAEEYQDETLSHQRESAPTVGGLADWMLIDLYSSFDTPFSGWTRVLPQMMESFLSGAEGLYKDQLPQEVYSFMIKRVEKYLRHVEKEFLLERLQDINDRKLALKDENFPQKIKEVIFPILFERNEKGLPTFEYIKKEEEKTQDLRQKAVLALVANLYGTPSYVRSMEGIRQEAYEKHLEEMIGLWEEEQKNGPLPEEIYDWKKMEEARFAPLAPGPFPKLLPRSPSRSTQTPEIPGRHLLESPPNKWPFSRITPSDLFDR